MKFYQFENIFRLFGYDSLQRIYLLHYEIFIIQMWKRHHVQYHWYLDDILILNDKSNVYHWYFMKFYQFENLFRLFGYDSLQHIYLHYEIFIIQMKVSSCLISLISRSSKFWRINLMYIIDISWNFISLRIYFVYLVMIHYNAYIYYTMKYSLFKCESVIMFNIIDISMIS